MLPRQWSGIKVFGGVTLDAVAGGYGLLRWSGHQDGAKFVWMPSSTPPHEETHRQRAFLQVQAFGNDVLTILDENDNIKPAVLEIIDMIAAAPVLCWRRPTSHRRKQSS